MDGLPTRKDLSTKCAAIRDAAYFVAAPAKDLRGQAKDKPGENLEELPGWNDHWNALKVLSDKRKEFVSAATARINTLATRS
jgi:hypothetical protein